MPGWPPIISQTSKEHRKSNHLKTDIQPQTYSELNPDLNRLFWDHGSHPPLLQHFSMPLKKQVNDLSALFYLNGKSSDWAFFCG